MKRLILLAICGLICYIIYIYGTRTGNETIVYGGITMCLIGAYYLLKRKNG